MYYKDELRIRHSYFTVHCRTKPTMVFKLSLLFLYPLQKNIVNTNYKVKKVN